MSKRWLNEKCNKISDKIDFYLDDNELTAIKRTLNKVRSKLTKKAFKVLIVKVISEAFVTSFKASDEFDEFDEVQITLCDDMENIVKEVFLLKYKSKLTAKQFLKKYKVRESKKQVDESSPVIDDDDETPKKKPQVKVAIEHDCGGCYTGTTYEWVDAD